MAKHTFVTCAIESGMNLLTISKLVGTSVRELEKTITTNCELNVTLELATDMKEYANCVMGCYQTDDEDDPYGDLDEGYRQGYMNYKNLYSNIKNEFYYIKVDNEVIGTTQSAYNNKAYGIYSLAIKKDYRNKGIGKEVLKQQLQMCKSKNISTAYLQTLKKFPGKFG